MRIYTRTGDDGTTGLLGGDRVAKSDPRLDCCGTLDELNAALGVAASGAAPAIRPAIHEVQNELFAIGSHLATPPDSPWEEQLPPLDPAWVNRLEKQIDAAEAQLQPLRQFILPGGSESAARLHLGRTICRRAERVIVSFSGAHPVAPLILTYLNRLSDWLFVHARLANHLDGVADVPWTRR